MRLAILLLTLLKSCRGNYPCLCNYATDTPIYKDPTTATSVINHMYEFSCSPIYTAAVGTSPGWQAVAKDHQIGYVKLSSNLMQQNCSGHPDPADTVTTNAPTPSTSTTTTSTTSASTTTTKPTPTSSTVMTTMTSKLPTTSSSAATSPVSSRTNTIAPTNFPAHAQQSTNQMTSYKPSLTTTSPPTQTPKLLTDRPTTPKAVTQTHIVSTQPYRCPSNVVAAAIYNRGYVQVHGNSCYELVPAKSTWQYAESNCNHKGGHLVHISNPDEENFIMKFLWSHNFNHAVWIGLNDIGHEEYFTWSSGDRFSYSKWTPGRKSNFAHHSYEDCVVLVPYLHAGFLQTFGQWDDVQCQHIYHSWICRYDSATAHGPRTTTLAPVLEILSHIFGK